MKDLGYDKAMEELKTILNQIENDHSIDKLIDRVSRSKELIQYCKDKLRNVETQLHDLTAKD